MALRDKMPLTNHILIHIKITFKITLRYKVRCEKNFTLSQVPLCFKTVIMLLLLLSCAVLILRLSGGHSLLDLPRLAKSGKRLAKPAQNGPKRRTLIQDLESYLKNYLFPISNTVLSIIEFLLLKYSSKLALKSLNQVDPYPALTRNRL